MQLNLMRRGQSGAGLIESLISVFVVSIGFIGFAGLQLKGLAAANESMFRSKAVYLSYQIADRVRANLPGAESGAYNDFEGSVSDPGCIATSCTAAQVAQTDFSEWSAEVAGLLPDGAAVICLDSTPDDGTPAAAACDGGGNVLAVKVWWSEKGTQHRFVTTLRP
ncbi:MAG TPA: type IV pilus modification protein PilV [Casimicrobiaceae bacterium]|nr:type IV pilus modification protein PilV [Casimicrobiaceae bacterium]